MKTNVLIIFFIAFHCLLLTGQNTQTIRPYVNAGPAIPFGILSDSPDQELSSWFMPENENRKGELLASGGGAKTGFTVEAGVLIPVHQVEQELLIDLMVGLDMTQMDFDWTNVHPDSWEEMVYMKTKPHRWFGLKLGPAATYRIDSDLAIGLSYTLHPTLATKAEWKYAYSIIDDYWMDKLVFNRGFAIKHALEANVQLRFLRLGVEADLGKIVHKEPTFYSYAIDSRYDSSPYQFSEDSFSASIPNNMLKIKLGVIIGN